MAGATIQPRKLETYFKWEFVRGYGSAVVADFAHNITADFVARLGLTALLAPKTGGRLGQRRAFARARVPQVSLSGSLR